MIPHWPFWIGGLFLAALPLVHWLVLRRMFAVSSRYTAMTGWMRRLLAPAAAVGDGAASAGQAGELSPHVVFLVGVILGGAASFWLATGHAPSPQLPSGLFTTYFGTSPIVDFAILFAGGTLVGYGTRMAGGCTSGHGLCGTSRLQPGSLVATACFFGTGIAVSFALQLLLGGGR